MNRTFLAALFVLGAQGLTGCGSSEPASPAPTPAVTPPSTPAEPAPAPTPTPTAAPPPTPEVSSVPTSARTPEAAYEAQRAAYERGDDAAYFGAYAETLTCFFGQANVPRAEVASRRSAEVIANRPPLAEETRAARIESLEVRRVRFTDDEVELVDHGWTGHGGTADVTFHAKRVLLRREATGWHIVAEGPAAGTDCGMPAIDTTAPPLWTAMRTRWTEVMASCEGPEGSTLEDGFPGIGGSNGCMPEIAITPSSVCEAIPSHGADCETTARAALERFVGEGMYPEAE